MALSEKIKKPVSHIRNWYGKYERPISSLSLIGGFMFDALTLKRVDLFWENFWVIAHIVIVGACIVLIHVIEKQEGDEANPSKLHFWLVNLQQFFYGGIWSVFLVFYFRSSDITASWPFLAVLALSFIANERLKRQFVRLTFQVALFFLAIFCFAIFLIPVLLHRIGTGAFLLSGAASLVFIALFLLLIRHASRRPLQGRWLLFGSIAGIFILMNVFYFTNLIPPIPLSLKDAGIYYSVQRDSQGNFVSMGEQQTWRDYITLYPTFHFLPGQPVVAFSAIFSPPGLNTTIYHEWQRYDGKTRQWVTVSRASLHMNGGRDGGFRTFSQKTSGLLPGRWRVNVLTAGGQIIGRIKFTLAPADSLPYVVEETHY
jgi:hypothetical protein